MTIAEITQDRPKHGDKLILIGMEGFGGSGNTTLVTKLSEALGNA